MAALETFIKVFRLDNTWCARRTAIFFRSPHRNRIWSSSLSETKRIFVIGRSSREI